MLSNLVDQFIDEVKNLRVAVIGETITDEFTLYEQDIFKYYFYSLGNCSQDLGQSELIEMGFGMSIRLIKVLP